MVVMNEEEDSKVLLEDLEVLIEEEDSKVLQEDLVVLVGAEVRFRDTITIQRLVMIKIGGQWIEIKTGGRWIEIRTGGPWREKTNLHRLQ